MGAAMMRRHALYFNESDRLTGMTAWASPDVIAQLRTCISDLKADSNGFVHLPIADAARAGKWAGGLSALTSPDYAATNAVYECLVYGVFNVFWEGGVDDALAGEESW